MNLWCCQFDEPLLFCISYCIRKNRLECRMSNIVKRLMLTDNMLKEIHRIEREWFWLQRSQNFCWCKNENKKNSDLINLRYKRKHLTPSLVLRLDSSIPHSHQFNNKSKVYGDDNEGWILPPQTHPKKFVFMSTAIHTWFINL